MPSSTTLVERPSLSKVRPRFALVILATGRIFSRRGGTLKAQAADSDNAPKAAALVMVTGNQEVIGDKIMYFPAQPLSSREVEAEMLSSEDTAQCRFFGGR